MVNRRAFTIVELLVAVAIIALLIALLFPSLSSARRDAKRAACASNLRQIGVGLRTYLGACNDVFPYASFMPSVGPLPVDGNAPIYIADALARDVGHQENVFQCPSDQTGSTRPPPNAGKSFFKTERSSYEYRVQLGGTTIEEFARRGHDHGGPVTPMNSIWIFRDFFNFHAPLALPPPAPTPPGSRRYLYVDGHVTDFES